MNTKRTIRKILFVTMWLTIGSGMLVLLIAAMGKQRRDNCKDYSVTIKGIRGDDFFLDEAAILALLKQTTKGKIKGQPKTAFNLRGMEQLLEDNRWVKDAQLYFDNQDVLHISVTERVPIARVFTTGTKSWYLDGEGMLMQLSDKMNVRLPVFTGFPDKKQLNGSDSTVLMEMVEIAEFINKDPFWSSQVAQVDIDPATREFDLIPVVGNQVIKLGSGGLIEQKLGRLWLFYKQVLSQTGFNKYKTIDVRFAGQVVAARSENPRVDSVQLRRNVEKLLHQIKEAEKLMEEQAKLPTPLPLQTVDTVAASAARPKPAESAAAAPASREPRAVMPRRDR